MKLKCSFSLYTIDNCTEAHLAKLTCSGSLGCPAALAHAIRRGAVYMGCSLCTTAYRIQNMMLMIKLDGQVYMTSSSHDHLSSRTTSRLLLICTRHRAKEQNLFLSLSLLHSPFFCILYSTNSGLATVLHNYPLIHPAVCIVYQNQDRI